MSWRGAARRTIPYLVLTTAGFLLAYAIVALFIFPSKLISSDRKVPSVVGLGMDDATKQLSAAGFVLKVGDKRYHGTAPAGTVISQNPLPGSVEPEGTTVKLAMSLGQRSGEVPAVIGLTKTQAELAIENAGFTVGPEAEQQSDAAARGIITASDPPAGTRLRIPAAVSLVVSSGPSTIQVPDVVGQTLGQARAVLGQVGMKLSRISTDSASLSAPNTVISQTPAAGRTVPVGSSIQLMVAGGASPSGAPAPSPPR